MTLEQMNNYMENFKEGCEKIKDIKITDNEIIIIYDITNDFKEKYDLYNKTRQLHIEYNNKIVSDYAYITEV